MKDKKRNIGSNIIERYWKESNDRGEIKRVDIDEKAWKNVAQYCVNCVSKILIPGDRNPKLPPDAAVRETDS